MREASGTGREITRRELLAAVGLFTAVPWACRARQSQEGFAMSRETPPGDRAEAAAEGRLLARPGRPEGETPRGLQPLGLGGRRDGWLYVPEGYRADRPAPLVLMLHGAGGDGRGGLGPFRKLADEAGLLLLSPDSRQKTWDVIYGRFGPDVAFIDRALEHAFTRCAVDPSRVAAEGFSDGASYALSVGLTNGDLFTHVIAFSPGFMAPAALQGRPRIYVSHGSHDQVLPVERCSRRIVPQLQRAGYDVRYHEFDGPHTVPPEIAREAQAWLNAGPPR